MDLIVRDTALWNSLSFYAVSVNLYGCSTCIDGVSSKGLLAEQCWLRSVIIARGRCRRLWTADWGGEFGSSILDGIASMKLRGMLGFCSIFWFSLKKRKGFFTQVEASLIVINVCSISFLNLTVQVIQQLNEAREKGMCN